MSAAEPGPASGPQAQPGSPAPGPQALVVVLGPGRSGTSTMAGALAYSGFTVPQAIKGNKTNPSGFFEPRWVVNFHRRLLRATGVRTLDTTPGVIARLQGVLTDPAIRAELRGWLAPLLEQHRRLVIKDPRLVWFRDLWVEVCRDLDVDPRFVVMLRHPSEVSSSRSNYYNAGETSAVAGWVNVALMTEQLTAGSKRALVHYPDLTADWRRELIALRDRYGVPLDPAPEVRPHPVDDFIDPGLRRMKPGWTDSEVPGFLQDLGERTFAALSDLAAAEAAGAATGDLTARLAALRTEYDQLHEDALAIVKPTLTRERQETTARVRVEMAEEAAAAAAARSLRRRVVTGLQRLTRTGPREG